ncbi:GHMP kinase [Candidatus Poribacteria bacterium]|nr:GHMP kinase [Candidatus Poribacteria bacterium]
MLITQTPLRISFVGGGTDMPDFYLDHAGAVVSTAIDKYIYVIVKERFDSDIYINYSKKEIVSDVDAIEHDIVRECMRKLEVDGGVEITFLADIPSRGTGLGSSSSVTVGLLNALHAYKGELVDAEHLAREACEVEIDILRHPIGKQDQYIAAYGNFRHIEFRQDDRVDVTAVRVSPEARRSLSRSLLLFYTGIERKANAVLAEQKQNIPERSEYFLLLKKLVPRTLELLDELNRTPTRGPLIEEFGTILHDGWLLKRQFASKVSNSQIDAMYETALEAGAIGGKLLGAGGGGFLLLCVPIDRQERVREALGHLREFPFDFVQDGSKMVFNIRQA